MQHRIARYVAIGIASALLILTASRAGARPRGEAKKPTPSAPAQAPAQASSPAPALPPVEDTAGKERALVLLAEGNRKLDAGLYLEALAAFEEAFRAFPSPRLHFNIAQTLHELGRALEALQHYEKFLADVKEGEMPTQWSLANERIFQLQGKVSALTLQCNIAGASVSIDGVSTGATPLPTAVRLLPGRHVILIDKAGYERRVVELELVAGQPRTERVELLTSAAALAQRQEFQRAEAARAEAELRLQKERSRAEQATARRQATLRTSAWISLGVGAAALATSAVTGTIAWRENAKVRDARPGTPWAGDVEDHYERATTFRRISYVSAAVGVVGLAAGGGLLLYGRSRGSPRAPAERAALVPTVHGGAGVAVIGRF